MRTNVQAQARVGQAMGIDEGSGIVPCFRALVPAMDGVPVGPDLFINIGQLGEPPASAIVERCGSGGGRWARRRPPCAAGVGGVVCSVFP